MGFRYRGVWKGRYLMAYGVTLSAEMDGTDRVLTWTFVGSPAVHYVYRQFNGGTWSLIHTVSGPLSPESYPDTGVYWTNTVFGYQIRDATGVISNTVLVGRYSDTLTETVNTLDSVTTSATASPYSYTDTVTVTCQDIATTAVDDEVPTDYVDEVTETVTCTDTVVTSIVTPQNYSYYLGSSNGMVYAYNRDEHGDNGVAINSYWKSKRLDFSDTHPQLMSTWKTISHVQVTYVDKGEATVTLSVSSDGGVSWKSMVKTFGSGTGKVADKSFYFWKTGRFFNFKIANNSSSEDFQWIRLTAHFMPQAEQFATA